MTAADAWTIQYLVGMENRSTRQRERERAGTRSWGGEEEEEEKNRETTRRRGTRRIYMCVCVYRKDLLIRGRYGERWGEMGRFVTGGGERELLLSRRTARRGGFSPSPRKGTILPACLRRDRWIVVDTTNVTPITHISAGDLVS